MGAEYVVIVVAFVGLCIFAFHLTQVVMPDSRSRALIILTLSTICGGIAAVGNSLHNALLLFFAVFAPAAIVFSALVQSIRWLRERNS